MTLKYSLLILFALQIFNARSFAETKNLVFVGDSLTAGYGLPEAKAYPALIEKRLQDEERDWKVINAGVSGDTTAGGNRRLDWILKMAKPDFIVIALGGNDMLRGLPPESTRENLTAMVNRVKSKKIPLALLGVAAPPNLGSAFKRKFDLVFKNLQKETGVPVLPNYIKKVMGKSSFNLSDLIHPNERGQEILGEEIYTFLSPFLAKAEAL